MEVPLEGPSEQVEVVGHELIGQNLDAPSTYGTREQG
jgi:hypothetical protein